MQGVCTEFSEALSLQKSGLIEEARRAYRQVLVSIPAHSDALHNLGIIEFSSGEGEASGTTFFSVPCCVSWREGLSGPALRAR